MIVFDSSKLSTLSEFGFIPYDDCWYHISNKVPLFSCFTYDCFVTSDGVLHGNLPLDVSYHLFRSGLLSDVKEVISYEPIS